MRIKKVGGIAITSFGLAVVLGTAYLGAPDQAMAQTAAATYTKMAPVEQYLMTDQSAEIELARSAAPASISRDAEVQVLGPHGFETAVKGKNGFVCFVGRSWTSAADADFWDPKVRVPMCVNAPAAHSYLLRLNKETEWGLAGRTQAQINEAVTAAIAKKELPPMEPGAMGYMMSKQGYGGDDRSPLAIPPHVFLFGYRPCHLGSESARFPRRWFERSHGGAPDAVRDSRATLVRRDGICGSLLRRASSLAPQCAGAPFLTRSLREKWGFSQSRAQS